MLAFCVSPWLFLLIAHFAIAAPVTNLTALRKETAPSWVSSPSGRGTWDLLYSCTFTIFLCVYSAIHLNVPPEESKLRFWLRKTKWVFIAILAPEIVVYTAFEQWLLSRRFLKELNELVESSSDDEVKNWASSYDKKGKFDMVYAQYALMGGFVTDISQFHNAITRVTINTNGVLFLARRGHFCKIKKEEIQDKSKADLLAKGLVCVQVLWVAGQAIERAAAGYPISLLEIHTLVHVVCAVTMYCLWIRKPLDIHDPTMLSSIQGSETLAFMIELSSNGSLISLSGRPGFEKILTTSNIPSEPKILWHQFAEKPPTNIPIADPQELLELVPSAPIRFDDHYDIPAILNQSVYIHTDAEGMVRNFAMDSGTPVKYIPVNNAQAVCTIASGQVSTTGWGPERSYTGGRERPTEVALSIKDIKRLDSVGRILPAERRIYSGQGKSSAIIEEALPASEHPLLGAATLSEAVTGRRYHESPPVLILRALNISGDFVGSSMSDAPYIITAMAIIPAAYGCVHIGALTLEFPTLTERLLWKISCYDLIATAICCGLLFLLVYFYDLGGQCKVVIGLPARAARAIGKRIKYSGDVISALSSGVFGLATFLYVLSRAYLVIESFISLRHVPIGVYQTPDINFMNYIPHL